MLWTLLMEDVTQLPSGNRNGWGWKVNNRYSARSKSSLHFFLITKITRGSQLIHQKQWRGRSPIEVKSSSMRLPPDLPILVNVLKASNSHALNQGFNRANSRRRRFILRDRRHLKEYDHVEEIQRKEDRDNMDRVKIGYPSRSRSLIWKLEISILAILVEVARIIKATLLHSIHPLTRSFSHFLPTDICLF